MAVNKICHLVKSILKILWVFLKHCREAKFLVSLSNYIKFGQAYVVDKNLFLMMCLVNNIKS